MIASSHDQIGVYTQIRASVAATALTYKKIKGETENGNRRS